AVVDVLLELVRGDEEVVDAVDFAGTRSAGGHRHAEVQAVDVAAQAMNHSGLTHRGWTGQDDQPTRGVLAGHSLVLGEAEALQQGATLTVTEATEAAGLGDLELLHDLLGLDLAHLREGLEQSGA